MYKSTKNLDLTFVYIVVKEVIFATTQADRDFGMPTERDNFFIHGAQYCE